MYTLDEFHEKSINVPSWSLPMNMIIMIEFFATTNKVKSSELLRDMFTNYFKNLLPNGYVGVVFDDDFEEQCKAFKDVMDGKRG